MEYCELSGSVPEEAVKADSKAMWRLWCLDHNKSASHCGPDGDTPVCEVFANSEGCNCCEKNYLRGELNAKMYKMAWDALSEEEQNKIRRIVEAEE